MKRPSTFRVLLHSLFLGLCAPGLLLLANPAQAQQEAALPAGVLATLGNASLTAADIKAATAGVAPERLSVLREMTTARENLASDLLLRRMIAELARKAGTDRDPEIAARLKIAEEKLLAELYLDKTENAAVDEKKLELMAREEYRAFPERFRKEEVLARHILVKDVPSCGRRAMEIIADLQARLKNGESFEALARQYSDDPGSAAKGGDLGVVVKGRTVPPFEDAVFAMTEPGSVAGPVETQFGLHLIQLIERKPAELLPFDAVKAGIMERLRTKQRQEMRSRLIETLKPPGALRIDDAAISAAVPQAPSTTATAGK